MTFKSILFGEAVILRRVNHRKEDHLSSLNRLKETAIRSNFPLLTNDFSKTCLLIRYNMKLQSSCPIEYISWLRLCFNRPYIFTIQCTWKLQLITSLCSGAAQSQQLIYVHARCLCNISVLVFIQKNALAYMLMLFYYRHNLCSCSFVISL